MNSPYDHWQADEAALAQIGAVVQHAPIDVVVDLPDGLAKTAIAAWERDEDDDALPANETADQRVARHRAGTLALIGAALAERGRSHGEYMTVTIDAWLVGHALDAADDRNLIEVRGRSPDSSPGPTGYRPNVIE